MNWPFRKKTRKTGKWPTVGCLVAVIFFAYGPLLRANYAGGDDFVLFFSDRPMAYAYLADGRWLMALAQTYIHEPIDSFRGVAHLRAVTVSGIIGLAIFFFLVTKCFGNSHAERFGFSISLAMLPCLHDLAGQANLWLAPVAGLCACWACSLTFHNLAKLDQVLAFFRMALLPLTLMILSAAIYQPMLGFYWTVAIVFALDPRFVRSAEFRRRMWLVIFAGLLYYFACFLMFKFSFVVSGVPGKARAALTTDPVDKLYWFLRIQLPLAMNYWQLMVSGTRWLPLTTAIFSGLVIAFGFILNKLRQTPRDWLAHFERICVIVGMLLLSHVHWLILKDSPQGYRMIPALGVAMWVLLFWSILQIARTISPRNLGRRIREGVMVMTAAVSVFVCQHYSEAYWVESSVLTFRYLVHELREKVTPQTEHVHLIRQGREDGIVRDYFIEGFGRPPTEAYWMIPDMVRFALRLAGVAHNVTTITQGRGDEQIPEEAGAVIDMRKITMLRVTE
jgi:hypothetical protein